MLSAHVAKWSAEGFVLVNEWGDQLAPCMLIASGADVKAVQARLRHASAKTTLDTYAHVWPDSDESLAIWRHGMSGSVDVMFSRERLDCFTDLQETDAYRVAHQSCPTAVLARHAIGLASIAAVMSSRRSASWRLTVR